METEKDQQEFITKNGWHLSNSVSLSQIISIFMLSIALIATWVETQKDIQSNYKDIEHLKEMQIRNDKRAIEVRMEINDRFDRLEKKIDYIISNKKF